MNSPTPTVKNRLNNLLITGLPRCGKTTLVKKVIQNTAFYQKSRGFITEEIREKGKRIGFFYSEVMDWLQP